MHDFGCPNLRLRGDAFQGCLANVSASLASLKNELGTAGVSAFREHLITYFRGRMEESEIRGQAGGDRVTVMQMTADCNADVLTMLLLSCCAMLHHVASCRVCDLWKTFEDLLCLSSGQVAISQLWLPGESLLCWICCFACSVRSFGRGREEAKLMQDAETSNMISMDIPNTCPT